MCEPIKNNINHDDVQLNNQINNANNNMAACGNDFSTDVEMENGHNITNGLFNSSKNKINQFLLNRCF